MSGWDTIFGSQFIEIFHRLIRLWREGGYRQDKFGKCRTGEVVPGSFVIVRAEYGATRHQWYERSR